MYHQAWRDAAYVHYKDQLKGIALPPCVMMIELPVTTKVRRDSSNFQKNVKPICDGIQRAGAWVDDTDEYVDQRNPTFRLVAKGGPKIVHVRMVER